MSRLLIVTGMLVIVAALLAVLGGQANVVVLPGMRSNAMVFLGVVLTWAHVIVFLGIGLILCGFLLIRPRLIEVQIPTATLPKPESVPKSVTFGSVRIGSRTDVGRKRTLNEDSTMAIETQCSLESTQRMRCVMVVGDGMGGHQKGEVASSIGVKTVAEVLQPLLLSDQADFASGLQRAIEEANSRVLDHSMSHEECQGMGTTLTAAVIDGQELIIGHVGDSRAYLIDNKEIVQVTRDHSLVQEMVEKGEITREQARTHPRRNVITRVVGYYGKVEPEVYRANLKQGDRVLLCCDGLVIHLTDDDIKQVVMENPDPREASERLVAVANERGGQDNISVMIADVRGTSP